VTALAGLRVLLVEDEYILVRQLTRALEGEGAAIVATAPSVRAALDAVAAARAVDVAILDVNLSGEKVYPVAELLQARGIPFLFSTGYGAEDQDPRFGDVVHLVKPVSMPALVKRLRTLIADPGRVDPERSDG
jgi:CheY-like chemotaxis protein